VPQKTTPGSSSDPTAVWRQWYDNAATVWGNMLDGTKEAYIDPFGMYRQWLKSAGEPQGMAGSTFPRMDPDGLWKEWLDSAMAMWRKVAGSSPADPLGLTIQWMERLEESRANMLSKEGPPLDPLRFLHEWYDQTSQSWSTVVGDIIGTDTFIESASRFLEHYMSNHKSLRQVSEKQLHQLQIPTRSDVARVAGLVVALEDKVDQLADAVDAANERHAQPVTEAALTALEQRLARVESRLDALLNAVEGLGAANRTPSEQGSNASQPPKRSTANRTRRASPPAGASRRTE
jgi:polyhydroxyalkanoic acid synthase PhaR subunit